MKKRLAYALVACSLSLFTSAAVGMLAEIASTQDPHRMRTVTTVTVDNTAGPSSAVAIYAPQDAASFEVDDEDARAAAESQAIDTELMGFLGSFVDDLDTPLDEGDIADVSPRLARLYALTRELTEKSKRLDAVNEACTVYIKTRWPEVQRALDNLLTIGRRVRPDFLARMFQKQFPNVRFGRSEEVFKVAKRYDWLALLYTEFTAKTADDRALNEAINDYLRVNREFTYRTSEGETLVFFKGLVDIFKEEVLMIHSLRQTIHDVLTVPGNADRSNREENIVERKLLGHASRIAGRIHTLYATLSRSMRIQQDQFPRVEGLEDIKILPLAVDRAYRQMAPLPLRQIAPPRRLQVRASSVSPSSTDDGNTVSAPPVIESPTTSVYSSGASSPVDRGSARGASASSATHLPEVVSIAPLDTHHAAQIDLLRTVAPDLVEAILKLPENPGEYEGSAGSKQRKNARNIAAVLGNPRLLEIVRPTPMTHAGILLKKTILQVMREKSPTDLVGAEALFTQHRSSSAGGSVNASTSSSTGRPPVYPPAAPQ